MVFESGTELDGKRDEQRIAQALERYAAWVTAKTKGMKPGTIVMLIAEFREVA